jgi:enterochelin esterase-like enzyme
MTLPNNRNFALAVLLFLLLGAIWPSHANNLAVASAGKIKRFEDFSSQYVPARNIDVWLPSNYHPEVKYDVLYMHDGQMLFDADITWNNQEWRVDEVASKLIQSGEVRPFIVVGIWHNNEARYPEYFPEKVFRELTAFERTSIKSKLIWQSKSLAPLGDFFYADRYLQFITNELMPFIEEKFNVNTGKEHTYIAGSSMGALISWYAVFEYPNTFGGAASMSTHWPGMYDVDNPLPEAFANFIKDNLSNLSEHKLYFDLGDQTLDSKYPPFQKNIDAILEKDYPTNLWKSEFFPGHKHDEASWSRRLHIPLTFLFGKR